MKITKKQLKRIILEEIGNILEADPEVDNTPLEVGDEVTYEKPEKWTNPEREGKVVKKWEKTSHFREKRHGYKYKVRWNDGLEEIVDGGAIVKNEAHP